MVIQSFVGSDFGLRPVRLEVVLTPGISQIQILGLADQVIKESSRRILSALRYQGFRMPAGKQVLVNLSPHYFRKTSQGLDLPIAVGILLESEQIGALDLTNSYVYGALSLKGEVSMPNDLPLLNYEDFNKKVVTGPSEQSFRFDRRVWKSLSEWNQETLQEGGEDFLTVQEPEINSALRFPTNLARLISIVALGEHSLLLAGHAGAGKTTLVESLVPLLRPPEQKSFLTAKKYWMLSGRKLDWRPCVQPHHSSSPLAMVGGGRPPKFGEISLAHGGALILDELLEFHPHVQSALREPMEKGIIYLSRAGSRKVFPADTLVLATTNLCRCGQFHPSHPHDCRCSSLRLRNYLENLSGPFLDRFCIFHLMKPRQSEVQVPLLHIKEELEKARDFVSRLENREKVNQKLELAQLMDGLSPKMDEEWIPHSSSHRRRLSLLRVARTLADLDLSPWIEQRHLEEAQIWTSQDFHSLEKFRFQDFATR
ncbi:MAG: ATP-binding protein [Bdellovibrionales bacterium]|nr:ATP-binding protein [Bdellovibrionales bacterium]